MGSEQRAGRRGRGGRRAWASRAAWAGTAESPDQLHERPQLPERRRYRPHDLPRHQPPAFAVVPVLLAVQLTGSYFASHRQPDRQSLNAVAFVLLAAGPLMLAARRRWPVPVLAGVTAVTLLYLVLGFPYGPVFLSLVVALFNAVTAGHQRAAWLAGGGLVVGHGVLPWLGGPADPPTLGQLTFVVAWLTVVIVVAEVGRARRARLAELARAQEEETRRRASDERLRIAREIHDVVAHSISLINVQAGVALHLLDSQPEQARTALTAIKQVSKDALGELRSTLAVLRQVDEAAPRSPAPSLARLGELVARSETAGLRIRTEVDGPSRPLPAGVDAAAYRIVQEALTNVTRHARASGAQVRVTYGEEDVVVQVDDDGAGTVPDGTDSPNGGSPGGSSGGSSGGNGILGMRERAEALGGELRAGPRAGGGFRVRARLPTGDGVNRDDGSVT